MYKIYSRVKYYKGFLLDICTFKCIQCFIPTIRGCYNHQFSSQAKRELKRQDDATARWETEREMQWSKNQEEDQVKRDSDSDDYVQIKRTDYKQDLRADKLFENNDRDVEGKRKPLTWREKRAARLKLQAKMKELM